jgi:5-methylcytosine-specific restriction endonuclease McrA
VKKIGCDSIADWANIRRRIVERDSYRCRICGKDGVEAKLNVHHKDWDRKHNENKNLVTLCQPCHVAVHMEGYKPCLYEDWPEPWGIDPD